MKYSEILSLNRELGQKLTGKPYRIAVLSNIVVNQLGDILEYELRRFGINAVVEFGDYNNIVRDSVRFADVNAAILFYEAANILEGLHSSAPLYSVEHLNLVAENVEAELTLALSNLDRVGLTLINRFSSMVFTHNDLRAGAFESLCNRLNLFLGTQMKPHQVEIHLDKVLSSVGLLSAVDYRQFLSSKALYTISMLKAYADHVCPTFLAANGKMRKVLALDCDNTLWGGVLGEDGVDGIQMNDATRAGAVFREVQQIALGLAKQGVLLALCSKNNHEDVVHILQNHPDIRIRPSDLVSIKVNWQDKASNLRELSRELNVGLDSIVFIDDSDFELELVRKELPEVMCVKVPKTLSDYPPLMRRVCRNFFVLSQSSEDARKTELYHENNARALAKTSFASTIDYLRSLQLSCRAVWNHEVSIARVAQLTQKTNQFNMTTRRYAEGDIARMIDSTDVDVVSFQVADRFGDYGVTALAIIRWSSNTIAIIDTFLMSCRIIGRNVELALIDYLVDVLRVKGARELHAECLISPKNLQFSEFYSQVGFTKTCSGEIGHTYKLALDSHAASGVDYIRINEDD